MFSSNASFHCDCVHVYTKKMIDVDGIFIFDGLTGAMICSQTDSIALRFYAQAVESAGPTVRKSSK